MNVNGALVSALLLLSAVAGAEGNSNELLSTSSVVNLNGTEIIIPELSGFSSINNEFPDVFKQLDLNTQPVNKLLLSFLSVEDIEMLRSGLEVMLTGQGKVLVARSIENDYVSRKMFEEIAHSIDGMSEKELKNNLDKAVDNVKGNYNKAGNPIEYSNKASSLGVLYEKKNSIGWGLVKTTAMSFPESDVFSTVLVMSFVYVKNKIIMTYIEKEYKGEDDIRWARLNSEKWSDQIILANSKNQVVGRNNIESVNIKPANGVDWAKVSASGVSGAVGAIGIIVVIIGFRLLLYFVGLVFKRENGVSDD